MDDLDMTKGSPTEDARRVLDFFSLDALLRLRHSMQQGKLIRDVYSDGDGGGCVLHWLAGIASKPQLLAFDFDGDKETWLAARRLVRWWDNQRLSQARLAAILHETIAERISVNALEDAAIAQVQQRQAASAL